MPGEWIKLQQEELYMKSRREGYTQIVAAAKSGISERSGRDIEKGSRKNPWEKARWRSCPDPLKEVWESELIPMLEQNPSLTAITLLEYLQDKYEDYPDSLLRTLQRRVKQWRVLYGPEKEVMFRQIHEAGRQALSDFTKLKKVTITIQGSPFDHLLYHFRLAYSHWSFIKVVQGGESYPALAEGLQGALKRLGGCPREHRTDSLSAAYKNLDRKAQEDMTLGYDTLCRHYGMTATRNNRGQGHENGSVESSHGHMKRRIEQALLLRGNCDFESIEAYEDFIDAIVEKANRRNAKAIVAERKVLQPLPQTRAIDYNEQRVVVSSSSTIEVRRVIYTVPSRLQGEVLNVRIYDSQLVCYLGSHHVVTLQRLHLSKDRKRGRQVDYRHVIHSLVKKPQAFRYSQLRNELLPDENYRFIWQTIDKTMASQEACKFIVGLLHLAATSDCEKRLGEIVMEAIKKGQTVSLPHLQKQFCKKSGHPEMEIIHHSLEQYNQLIPQHHLENCYHA
jgi:transcriptional regulator with XRE-family HTH domain